MLCHTNAQPMRTQPTLQRNSHRQKEYFGEFAVLLSQRQYQPTTRTTTPGADFNLTYFFFRPTSTPSQWPPRSPSPRPSPSAPRSVSMTGVSTFPKLTSRTACAGHQVRQGRAGLPQHSEGPSIRKGQAHSHCCELLALFTNSSSDERSGC